MQSQNKRGAHIVQVLKSRLGQLLEYLCGYALWCLHTGVLGVYMEGGMVCLLAFVCVACMQEGKYVLKLKRTASGQRALDIYSPRGCIAVLKCVQQFIS